MGSNSKENNKSVSSYKLLWQSLPANFRRFFIVVLVVLLFSAAASIFYFSDAVGELKYMSQQIDKNMSGEQVNK